ncbi:MAG: nucleoside:proton symporter [Alphaproteobacteria bacterium]|nr:nucleoside:proton symporter [Alphaproteobacteria bacterium]
MDRLQAFIGMFAILGIAWTLAENRRHVSLRAALLGLAVSFVCAALFLKLPYVATTIGLLNAPVQAIADATRAGTTLVFGYLGGGPLPFDEKFPGASFVLAIQALPIVLVVSALTPVLFHWGVMPAIVRAIAWALRRTMGVGGAVGLSTAANVFVGMVEAPLFIRPYLAKLTRAELFIVMVGGMASIAGTVMVLYATLIGRIVPDAFAHILIASLLSAPVTILIARIMVPETTPGATEGELGPLEPVANGAMDAIVKGTAAGLELLLNICAMLIVLVALVALVNAGLGLLPDAFGAPLKIERMLGWIFAPICWLMGIPWAEAPQAGALLGLKTALNEFVAYLSLAGDGGAGLSERTRLIMLYALCGFANFGSLGIMIGGMATMCPARRPEIVELGFKSLVAGTLAPCLMGAMAAVLY